MTASTSSSVPGSQSSRAPTRSRATASVGRAKKARRRAGGGDGATAVVSAVTGQWYGGASGVVGHFPWGGASVRYRGAVSRAPAPPGSTVGRAQLSHPDVVAKRVAQTEVDAVGLLGGLLGDLEALRRQLVIRRAGIGGGEEKVRSRPAAGEQFAHPFS